MSNPLAKFIATVEFKALTKQLDSTISKLKSDLTSIVNSPAVKKARQAEAKDFNQQVYAYKKHMQKVMKDNQKHIEASKKLIGLNSIKRQQERGSLSNNTELGKMAEYYKKQQQEALVFDQQSAKIIQQNSAKFKEQQARLEDKTELEKLSNFYRKQELQALKEAAKAQKGMDSLHSQALRDNMAYDKRKERQQKQDQMAADRVRKANERERKAQERHEARIANIRRREAEKQQRIEQQIVRQGEASRIRSAAQSQKQQQQMGISVAGTAGAIATGGFAHQAYSVGNFSTSRMPQFEFLTGSAEKAREQVAFVDKEAKRLSIDIVEANGQYKQLLASAGDALGIQKTQDLFSSFSEISTMLGLSGDAQNRGIRAFSQIKDTVCLASNSM